MSLYKGHQGPSYQTLSWSGIIQDRLSSELVNSSMKEIVRLESSALELRIRRFYWSVFRPKTLEELSSKDFVRSSPGVSHYTVGLTFSTSVVFVHGLSDDHRSTWSCGDFFWPECLFEDLPTIRVLLFQYDAKIWMQSDVEPIQKTARDMLSLLGKSRSRVRNSSTVWISHSLGGLLVKVVSVIFLRFTSGK